MATKPIQITDFNGQAENAHIGFGVNVGVDLYTTKNVARLSRKMERKGSSVTTSLPVFITEDNSGVLYVQCSDGRILKSTDDGDTWTHLSGNAGSVAKGLVVWQNYLWSFTGTGVDLYGPLTAGPAWINSWTGFTGGQALINATGVNHIPFPFPAANALMYITNRNYIAQVKVIGATFDPTSGATYEALAKKLTMQDYWVAQTIGFLPTSSVAIGVENKLNNSQSDVVIWDGTADATAINVLTLPGAYGPVTNLLTRNGILYATTTNEAGVYTINGSSAQIVDRIGLRMTNRTSGGAQNTERVNPRVRVQSADFLGPEILVGICNTDQPVNHTSGTGLYPYGVWGINVEDKIVYTKFPLSHGEILATYSNDFNITFVKVISNGKVIVGWNKDTTYGIDVLNPTNYISDANTVFIESEFLEVGTRINPVTFNHIQYNLVEPLQGNEEISFYYRTSQGSNYTLFWTDTATTLGSELGGIINPLPFQKVKYIQIGIRIKTDTSTTRQTPQLVSVYIE